MISRFSALPRSGKSFLIVASDVFFLPLALWLSIGIRLDIWAIPFDHRAWWIYPLPSLIAVPVFLRAGLYRSVIRYIEQRAIVAMLKAVSVAVAIFSVSVVVLGEPRMPFGALFVFWLLSISYVVGSRFGARAILQQHLRNHDQLKRVIVYGAGSSGVQTVNALRSGKEYLPVAFVDDNANLHGLQQAGLNVYSPAELKKLRKGLNARHVLLAMPSASRNRRVEIVNALEPLKFEVKSIPGMVDLVEGEVRISDIREVEIEELLGRDAVPPDSILLNANNHGKVVMVTGAGGSIGSELCRQVLACEPTCLVLYEISEFALYTIKHELRQKIKQLGLKVDLQPVLGSVRDIDRLRAIMARYAVQTVYHAAAYKHVPLVEFNITEGILNNSVGTWLTANAAQQASVETFVLISTDKVVRPTNVMGASKRMAELALQALAAEPGCNTRFCMVRFGNVLGSSGSVVPLFRKQIAAGGPVTVTHPEINRFFMTIPEASQLVIQAGAMGGNGEVFVLDMGKPVKIYDLAKRMIHLSGCSIRDEAHPNGDIAIQLTGLRPGEKLYEELFIGDAVAGTRHPRIMKAQEDALTKAEYEIVLQELISACAEHDFEKIVSILLVNVHGFKPDGKIHDHLVEAQSIKVTNTNFASEVQN